MFFSFFMINNILFLLMKNPLVMSVTLLAQALSISFFLATASKTPWISYVLVMVFMSAVMMIFLYFSSLTSNIPFYLNNKEMFLSFLIFIGINMFFYLKVPPVLEKNKMTFVTLSTMKKIYSSSYFFITSTIMFILFVALVVVTTNTRNCKKPLRVL